MATYDLLDSTTLGTSAASVTFSGISGSYRDLVLVVEATSTAGSGNGVITIEFNSDTGSNYETVIMRADGSTATSFTSGSSSYLNFYVDAEEATPVLAITQIMDYSATDKHKTVLQRANNAGTEVGAGAGRWASTAAITSLKVSALADQYEAGSTFYLYGIAA